MTLAFFSIASSREHNGIRIFHPIPTRNPGSRL